MPKSPRQPKKTVKYPPHRAGEINPLDGLALREDSPAAPNSQSEIHNPKSTLTPFFSSPGIWLYHNNCLEVMDAIAAKYPEGRFDMIFADPPYFLSNGGITCHAGRMVSVHKGDWDQSRGWEWNHEFNTEWLRRCQRVLKPNGTLWVTGTHHVIFSVGFALQQLGFKLLNDIAWEKPNPPPNLSCRYFTHSTETILWAAKNAKSKHLFNYQDMRKVTGKQMKTVWRREEFRPQIDADERRLVEEEEPEKKKVPPHLRPSAESADEGRGPIRRGDFRPQIDADERRLVEEEESEKRKVPSHLRASAESADEGPGSIRRGEFRPQIDADERRLVEEEEPEKKKVPPHLRPSAESADKGLESIWTLTAPGNGEKEFGKHPTQKPVALLERCLMASTNPGDLVLDPFLGGGTTAVACVRLRRGFVGVELDLTHVALAAKRADREIVLIWLRDFRVRVEITIHAKDSASRRSASPSPGGEGWGEGGQRTKIVQNDLDLFSNLIDRSAPMADKPEPATERIFHETKFVFLSCAQVSHASVVHTTVDISLQEAWTNAPTGKKRETTHIVRCETEILRLKSG